MRTPATGGKARGVLLDRMPCVGAYPPSGGIEHSLLQRFWLVARREVLPHGHRSIAAALCDPTSNNATSQKRCSPPGKGRFGLRLRCSLGRVSLRIHSCASAEAPRASPQAKPALCKLYSIPPSGQYSFGSHEILGPI